MPYSMVRNDDSRQNLTLVNRIYVKVWCIIYFCTFLLYLQPDEKKLPLFYRHTYIHVCVGLPYLLYIPSFLMTQSVKTSRQY